MKCHPNHGRITNTILNVRQTMQNLKNLIYISTLLVQLTLGNRILLDPEIPCTVETFSFTTKMPFDFEEINRFNASSVHECLSECFTDIRCELGKFYEGLDKCILYEVYDTGFLCKVINIKFSNYYD